MDINERKKEIFERLLRGMERRRKHEKALEKIRVDGIRYILRRIIRLKFALPASYRLRIKQADEETLLRIADKYWSAHSLWEMFEEKG